MNFFNIIYAPIEPLLAAMAQAVHQSLETEEDDDFEELLFVVESFAEAVSKRKQGGGPPCLSMSANMLSGKNRKLLETLVPTTQLDILAVLVSGGLALENDQDLDFSDEIALSMGDFALFEDANSALPFAAFAYVNPLRQLDSIGFLNFAQCDWDQALKSSGFNHDFLACFLNKLSEQKGAPVSSFILARADANLAAVKSTLRFQAVAHGRTIHVPINSSLNPSLACVTDISAKQPYQQFDELILILSEFNSRTEVLSKFLSLYHVVESFMYKLPLVELGKSNNGKMFSLRDFKRMYRQLDMNENAAIKNLCTVFWDVSLSATTFGKLAIKCICDMLTHADFAPDEADLLLARLGLFDKSGTKQLVKAMNPAMYSKLLYGIRNSIVHNGETELHISHFNLSRTVTLIIEEAIMKPLEILLLTLVADGSSIVWYKGPSLQLYEA